MPSADPIADMLDARIDQDEIAGAVTVVWKHGKVVQSCARGWRDRDALEFLEGDAIFRIASMTKPITSVAALMLLDEGRITLETPITDWAPEFAEMQVLRQPGAALSDTVPARRGITFGDLLTHRSGLTYGGFHAGPIGAALENRLVSDIDSPLPPDDWMAALAGLPLIDQPGAGFHYGHSTDLLGFLIARIEGEDLGQILRRRIFAPLGMADTGFVVPPHKAHRKAALHGWDAQDKCQMRPLGGARSGSLLAERPPGMRYLSGGAGLWSTALDYLRFAQLFLGDGQAGGIRLLRPETLQAMRANHLTPDQRQRGNIMGQPLFAGHGFGLGLACVTNPALAQASLCQGAPGTVGWPGAFGTWWQADPADQSVMIFLSQTLAEPEQMARGLGLGIHAAISDVHRLAQAF